jgi:hypothetical protein
MDVARADKYLDTTRLNDTMVTLRWCRKGHSWALSCLLGIGE